MMMVLICVVAAFFFNYSHENQNNNNKSRFAIGSGGPTHNNLAVSIERRKKIKHKRCWPRVRPLSACLKIINEKKGAREFLSQLSPSLVVMVAVAVCVMSYIFVANMLLPPWCLYNEMRATHFPSPGPRVSRWRPVMTQTPTTTRHENKK